MQQSRRAVSWSEAHRAELTAVHEPALSSRPATSSVAPPPVVPVTSSPAANSSAHSLSFSADYVDSPPRTHSHSFHPSVSDIPHFSDPAVVPLLQDLSLSVEKYERDLTNSSMALSQSALEIERLSLRVVQLEAELGYSLPLPPAAPSPDTQTLELQLEEAQSKLMSEEYSHAVTRNQLIQARDDLNQAQERIDELLLVVRKSTDHDRALNADGLQTLQDCLASGGSRS
eukprot:TRINITY_DN15_c0_g1_i1.p1 TRINITY_DN15_c0_g1~~TRINITY_DN15_c0_g1_i1.p1  ORF type:complete len:229 (+),score=37.15 TRINITY_DN15_c0_g1_i1:109-795(+)